MASPSSGWAQRLTLDKDGENSAQTVGPLGDLDATVAKAEPLLADFEKHVSGLRNGIACTIDPEKRTNGSQSLIYEITFIDGVYWILRITMLRDQETANHPNTYWDQLAKSTVAAMKLVRAQTTIPVPEVYDFGLSESVFGMPYIVMEAARGKDARGCGLKINSNYPTNLDELNPGKENIVRHVFQQIADYQVQLLRLTFDKIGPITMNTGENGVTSFAVAEETPEFPVFRDAYSYWDWRCKEQLRKALSEDPERDESDAKRLMAAYRMLLLGLINVKDALGPFPLFHSDLCTHNFVMEEDGTITAVIDWEQSATVPVELGANVFVSGAADLYWPNNTDHTPQKMWNASLAQVQGERALPLSSGRSAAEMQGCPAARLVWLLHMMPHEDMFMGFVGMEPGSWSQVGESEFWATAMGEELEAGGNTDTLA